MINWGIAFVIFLLAYTTWASPGDDLDDFVDCRYQCEQLTCLKTPYHENQDRIEAAGGSTHEFRRYNPNWSFDAMPLSSHLKALRWNCVDNCDYQCQRIVTKERKDHNEEVLQFHGKWPFLRIYGIQELASLIFSLGNMLVHFIGFLKIVRVLSDKDVPFRLKYQYTNILLLSVVTILAWMFSAIFHTRDFELTEKLDYYFAALTVFTGLHMFLARLARLYLPNRVIARWLVLLICITCYAAHIYRMETDWLYTYNMQLNVGVAILQNICLSLACYNLYSDYYNSEVEENETNLSHLKYISKIILPSFFSTSAKLYCLYPMFLAFVVIVGMSLEIFDFLPIIYDLVDAHSLWHLVTIIPVYYGYYDWVLWDVNENIWKDITSFISKKED